MLDILERAAQVRRTLLSIVTPVVLSLLAAPTMVAAAPARPPVSEAALKQATRPSVDRKAAAADTGMTLRGGQERTDLRTLTVEGEDRVHLEIERPQLTLDLDPEKVGGLESGTAADVLNRAPPDLITTYLSNSALGMSPYVAHPWLRLFATGPVARFKPNVKDVERWKLVVADSKGQTVNTFNGKGDPPREITWDGRSSAGALVSPGVTYSYIFEAYDRAGNKRNFVGEGFSVSAYRLDSPEGPTLVFSGQSLLASSRNSGTSGAGTAATGAPKIIPPILIEAAGWLNQSAKASQPIRVTATARSSEQAQLLAGRVTSALGELAFGDASHIQAVTEVAPDAPDGGTIRISPLSMGASAPERHQE